MRTKILPDADIGTDIDDAVCITYLLANPECDLLGITTVTGEAERRAMLASALCRFERGTVDIETGDAGILLDEIGIPAGQTFDAGVNRIP